MAYTLRIEANAPAVMSGERFEGLLRASETRDTRASRLLVRADIIIMGARTKMRHWLTRRSKEDPHNCVENTNPVSSSRPRSLDPRQSSGEGSGKCYRRYSMLRLLRLRSLSQVQRYRGRQNNKDETKSVHPSRGGEMKIYRWLRIRSSWILSRAEAASSESCPWSVSTSETNVSFFGRWQRGLKEGGKWVQK